MCQTIPRFSNENSQSTRALLSVWFMHNMSPRSTLRVSEVSRSVIAISNEDQGYVDHADGNKSYSWYQECMPIDSLLDHNHRYTRVHTTSDSSVSLTISAGIYTAITVAHFRDQRVSREVPKESKKVTPQSHRDLFCNQIGNVKLFKADIVELSHGRAPIGSGGTSSGGIWSQN